MPIECSTAHRPITSMPVPQLKIDRQFFWSAALFPLPALLGNWKQRSNHDRYNWGIRDSNSPKDRLHATLQKFKPRLRSRTSVAPEFHSFPTITGDTRPSGSESGVSASGAPYCPELARARGFFCPRGGGERRLAPLLVPDTRQGEQLLAYVGTV